MKRIVLSIALIAAATLPLPAADMLGIGASVAIGANKEFMDAGVTAVDLSASVSLSVLPIQLDDMSAGVTMRARPS